MCTSIILLRTGLLFLKKKDSLRSLWVLLFHEMIHALFLPLNASAFLQMLKISRDFTDITRGNEARAQCARFVVSTLIYDDCSTEKVFPDASTTTKANVFLVVLALFYETFLDICGDFLFAKDFFS